MTGYDCAAYRSSSAELALGILPAEERAAAAAHLAGCSACRYGLQRDTVVADRLLTLFPANEPPIGFEQRVVERLEIEPARGRSRRWPRRAGAGMGHWLGTPGVRRTVAAAAAVVLVGAGVLGGVLLGQSSGGSPAGGGVPVPVSPGSGWDSPGRPGGPLLGAPLMAGQRQVGEVYAYTGGPPWVYMNVDLGASAGGAPVQCELVRRDGSAAVIGGFGLTAGRGYWGAPSPIPSDSLAAARVMGADGSVLATAAFDHGH